MNAKTFHLVITSVTGAQFDGRVVSVTLPATEGEMTVLPDHEPIITTLKPGVIVVRAPDAAPCQFDIENGVFEYSGNRATVLL